MHLTNHMENIFTCLISYCMAMVTIVHITSFKDMIQIHRHISADNENSLQNLTTAFFGHFEIQHLVYCEQYVFCFIIQLTESQLNDILHFPTWH